MDFVAMPREYLKLHDFSTLVADLIVVSNIPFLITMSRGILFVTV